jgi:hypothetical protein
MATARVVGGYNNAVDLYLWVMILIMNDVVLMVFESKLRTIRTTLQ